jgi:hypothetical protein
MATSARTPLVVASEGRVRDRARGLLEEPGWSAESFGTGWLGRADLRLEDDEDFELRIRSTDGDIEVEDTIPVDLAEHAAGFHDCGSWQSVRERVTGLMMEKKRPLV